MNLDLANALAATLPAGRDGLFNPYVDRCSLDIDDDAFGDTGPAGRKRRLAAHLDRSPRLILLGEAPGYQGCRYSGIAFASERQLLDGAIPGVERIAGRLTKAEHSFAEPSATIVWKALYRLRLDDVVTWNAVQLHPHAAGSPWTNRTPTRAELELGRAALGLLREAFPAVAFIAVGKKAAELLRTAGLRPEAMLRHPANGGATEFSRGLQALAAG